MDILTYIGILILTGKRENGGLPGALRAMPHELIKTYMYLKKKLMNFSYKGRNP